MVAAPDGSWLATVDHSGSLRLRAPDTGAPREVFGHSPSAFVDLAVTADGARIALLRSYDANVGPAGVRAGSERRGQVQETVGRAGSRVDHDRVGDAEQVAGHLGRCPGGVVAEHPGGDAGDERRGV